MKKKKRCKQCSKGMLPAGISSGRRAFGMHAAWPIAGVLAAAFQLLGELPRLGKAVASCHESENKGHFRIGEIWIRRLIL